MKWANVLMHWRGRTILGIVREVYEDGTLRVIYFNGEPWPVCPAASDVVIIERGSA
jgi:hypothetical protein